MGALQRLRQSVYPLSAELTLNNRHSLARGLVFFIPLVTPDFPELVAGGTGAPTSGVVLKSSALGLAPYVNGSGTSDGITFPKSLNAFSLLGGDLTVSGWFKIDPLTGYYGIIEQNPGALDVYVSQSNNQVEVSRSDGTNYRGWNGGGGGGVDISGGGWHYFAFSSPQTNDSGTFFVDGTVYPAFQAYNSGGGQVGGYSSTVPSVGFRAVGGTQMKGQVQNIKIWSRRLSNAEMQLDYQQPWLLTQPTRHRALNSIALAPINRPLVSLIV